MFTRINKTQFLLFGMLLLSVLLWRPELSAEQKSQRPEGLWLAPGSVQITEQGRLKISFRARTLLWVMAWRQRSRPNDKLVIACNREDLRTGAAAKAYLLRLGVSKHDLELRLGGAMASAPGALRVLQIHESKVLPKA